MRTLLDFQVPVCGDISICLINGEPQTVSSEYANLNELPNPVPKNPKVHIRRDALQSFSSGDEGKTFFMPVKVSFLKQLAQTYYEQGFYESLQYACSYNHPVISKVANTSLKLYNYVRRIQTVYNPRLLFTGADFINQLSQTRNWSSNTIRCIAWHSHVRKVAVATCDDSVRIFTEGSDYIPLLRCKQQKNVTCISWRPMSITEIAVGYERGVIVWNVDPNSLVVRPSISNATILYRVEHSPVMSLSWSPRGNLLITAAACDPAILVWDVELDQTSILKRHGGDGNDLIKWSPSGEKLVSATTGLIFRIWDCRNWECERWTVLSGRVQTACWSNCGTNLLFATSTEPIIYGMIVKSTLVYTSDVESSSLQALPLFDVSKIDAHGVFVGGLIQTMETDPKGKHLAVLFQNTNYIAIFSIARQYELQVIPSSLVIGLAEEIPSTICFQEGFVEGACLTIGWSSGRVQYYPIIYSDLRDKQDFNTSTQIHSKRDPNQTLNSTLYNSTLF